MKITQLHIYPIKSLGGISLQESSLSDRGLWLDRRFMLVDEEGIFLTQRNFPELALLALSLQGQKLTVSHKLRKIPPLHIPVQPGYERTSELDVVVWDDIMPALHLSEVYDKWFSDVLNSPVRLVYMPDGSHRPVKEKYSRNNNLNSFSDAMPILIIGEDSLKDLNDRLDSAVPMDRFRPNIVFEGGGAFAEDGFHEIHIGKSLFWGMKHCARCNMTTIDQKTAEVGKEPLKTLSKYRRLNNKVLFGMNLLSESEGSIRVGDDLKVISHREKPF
ncbi:MAG: MOSC domain-containing protein [Bacteroidia bacterium]|nr:MOSC domain-containing protein [Bacteroidia bacterium]